MFLQAFVCLSIGGVPHFLWSEQVPSLVPGLFQGGRYPSPVQIPVLGPVWGVPQTPQTGQGYLSSQNRGYPPGQHKGSPTTRHGVPLPLPWQRVPSGQDRGNPPTGVLPPTGRGVPHPLPDRRASDATSPAVCLLRSRRRTVLFRSFCVCWLLH